MLTAPSIDFTTAANADYREPKLRIDVLWTDPFVQSGNVITSPNVNNFCGLDSSVVDDLLGHVADTRLSTPHKYIINDGTWINDGTFYPIPGTIEDAANNQVGWYTSEVAGGGGFFENPPEITVDFAEARTIQQLIVLGEPTLSEYPTEFDVYIYDDGDNLLNTVTEFSATSVETILDFTSDNITTASYMVLKLFSWSAPNTIGKIVEFFGVITDTFHDADIVSMDILEEMESDEEDTPFGTMSANELNIELQNVSIERDSDDIVDPFLPENASSYLTNSITKNVRLSPAIGFRELNASDQPIEYVPMGVFWSTDWDVSQSEFSARVIARDRFELLRLNTFFDNEILVNVTLAEVAEHVLNHAKINIPLNDLEWEIDSDLANYTVNYVWFGRVTYFEAIKKIASACLGRAYCNRSGKIIIESYISDSVTGVPDFSIGTNDFFKQSRKMQSVKNYVSVPVCPLEPEAATGDIFESETISVFAGQYTVTQNITWGEDAVMDHAIVILEESGVTMFVTSEIYYPWGADVTFTKISGTDGTFSFKMTGRRLVPVTYIPDAVASDEESIRLLNKQEHRLDDNYLIQTSEMANIIANAMLSLLLERWRNVENEVPGNPCTEIGDLANIEVYSKQSISHEYRTIRQQFNASKDGLRCMITSKRTIDFGS
jgi:hypothetical protein